jgi:hypothetical protein
VKQLAWALVHAMAVRGGLSRTVFGCAALALAPVSWGAGFGVYEPRAQAMGGAAVALGDLYNGFYYNPALLAFHDTSKNRGKFSRWYFPSATLTASEAALDALEVSDDNLDIRLTDAIDSFNRVTSRESAAQALAITEEIDRNIDKLTNKSLDADGYTGLAVVVPSEYQGGALYLGARALGGGQTEVAEADRALLNKYREFLTFASQNDTLVGAPHPELVDQTTGQIGNPANAITSYAVLRGAVLTELGVAAAGLWSFERADLALGITPKVVQALVFDEERRVVEESIAENAASDTHLYLNADLGLSLQWREAYRVAFAIKDLKTKEFVSDRGNRITLKPRPRLGLAYVGERYSLGGDLDLTASTAFAGEKTRQDLSLGGEWRTRHLALRGGYQYDISGNRAGMLSAGLGFSVWRWVGDLSYNLGSEDQGAGLRMGMRF